MQRNSSLAALVAIALFFIGNFPSVANAENRGAPIYGLMLHGNLANDSVTLSKRNTSQQAAEKSAADIVQAKKDFDAALPTALKAAGKNVALATAVKDYHAAESAYLTSADPGNIAARSASDEKEAILRSELQAAGL